MAISHATADVKAGEETFVDVLIIGAGPAGLMAANALASAGVSVKIIDKRPLKVAVGQADGIQPRTIEVLQSYGLAERLLREGNQMHVTAFYNPSPAGGIERTGREADVNAPDARYPFGVTLHQGAIENIFLDSMKENGLEVQRPYQPESLEIVGNEDELLDSSAHVVKVTLRRLNEDQAADFAVRQQRFNAPLSQDGLGIEDDIEVVRAKYVIGADGAHSWVRKTLGFTMDGEQTDYIWGVVDGIPETDFPDIRNGAVIHSDSGSCMVLPREGDTVRLYVQLEDKDIRPNGRIDRTKFGPELVIDMAKKSLVPYSISFPNNVEWWTVYIIGQRVASHYSAKERVFIAGDACHTHSPKAGQGMNASMNDTHNLAWKLVHVLRGWANQSILKTYEDERRQYAQDLIDFDKKFSKLCSEKVKTDENEHGATEDEFLAAYQEFGLFTSGIGVHYPDSVVINTRQQEFAKNLVIGKRFIPQHVLRAADFRPYNIQDLMPADGRFKIFLFCGDISSEPQRQLLEGISAKFDAPTSFLSRFTNSGHKEQDIFDIMSICTTKKETINFTDMPIRLRSHWSKVYTDDVSLYGKLGGNAYETYGITLQGAVVVVRPDGYVAMIAGLEDVESMNEYFGGFLQSRK